MKANRLAGITVEDTRTRVAAERSRIMSEFRIARDASHRAEGKSLHIKNIPEVFCHILRVISAVIGRVTDDAERRLAGELCGGELDRIEVLEHISFGLDKSDIRVIVAGDEGDAQNRSLARGVVFVLLEQVDPHLIIAKIWQRVEAIAAAPIR